LHCDSTEIQKLQVRLKNITASLHGHTQGYYTVYKLGRNLYIDSQDTSIPTCSQFYTVTD